MNLGTITIKNLKISCIIGILEHERDQEQELFFDINLKTPFDLAEQTEDINNTINYTTLTHFFSEWVKREQFFLIETLVKRGCSLLLNQFKLIHSCKISVQKPKAILISDYAEASFQLSRSNLES